MKKKNLWKLLTIMMVAILSVSVVSCGGDDDDNDISGGDASSKAKVSLKLSGGGTSYTATVSVSGVDAADVFVLGVRAEPQSSTGYKPAIYVEAGTRSTKGTCKLTLQKGTTYFVYGYANVDGKLVNSSKQTVKAK